MKFQYGGDQGEFIPANIHGRQPGDVEAQWLYEGYGHETAVQGRNPGLLHQDSRGCHT